MPACGTMTSSNGIPYPLSPEVAEYAEAESRANTRIVFATLTGPDAAEELLDGVVVLNAVLVLFDQDDWLEASDALDVNDALDVINALDDTVALDDSDALDDTDEPEELDTDDDDEFDADEDDELEDTSDDDELDDTADDEELDNTTDDEELDDTADDDELDEPVDETRCDEEEEELLLEPDVDLEDEVTDTLVTLDNLVEELDVLVVELDKVVVEFDGLDVELDALLEEVTLDVLPAWVIKANGFERSATREDSRDPMFNGWGATEDEIVHRDSTITSRWRGLVKSVLSPILGV